MYAYCGVSILCVYTQNPSQPSVKSCACNPGFADASCNVPVTSLSGSNGVATTVMVPGKSWRYFYVNVPFSGSGSASLMSVLTKPPLSASTYNYQPVLQMTARSSGTTGTAFYPIPGYSGIDPSSFVLQVHLLRDIYEGYCKGLCNYS